MSFTLYPAIDLRGGQCVRLFQGDYDAETVYGDPVEAARRWVTAGAEWLHVVDLDAAKTGEPVNLPVIKEIAVALDVPVQVGGGVRNMERLKALLELGVSRVVIGSAAIDDPDFVKQALAQYGDRIALGLDARDGRVATHGWLDVSEVLAENLAKEMVRYGAETFIFTDISRDGTLTGPNIPAVRSLARACGKEVIASGGVRNIHNLVELAKHREEGVSGAIVGKALYTGDVDLAEALRTLKEGSAS
ncbi:1-(5-phosphoribosyl)-5-[(5-phosphoribosylamino) methylideneamino] imidazole-4-carboxamide isomerase [Marinithermofilum abyssi]|uniref:1-(5-phosphoribosyl)-5-[(5-phosphoribosylamino)methylideneamino] imidazole-4-carboxamide isomerase n=1 Tax=Marinithermofilum abyssi TaxID=1571185 RepID=A0A8J2VFK6_9BACL|nr:1-(5-phosphoribosyl)-5-[(5-phosphoribosylamino)methylideneamino]imidazole-4-carboxamide isomerase [Marinithermofilum abyssi]GGE04259.1 1-(5-phosphoribosyl)-5-[(5-phosphoribosylamino) methylideneamino] imidazole-4-carboxamide isomerase [Marinithermofilum abyssi]